MTIINEVQEWSRKTIEAHDRNEIEGMKALLKSWGFPVEKLTVIGKTLVGDDGLTFKDLVAEDNGYFRIMVIRPHNGHRVVLSAYQLAEALK